MSAPDPVEAHAAALSGALHGPARLKDRMLAEFRDGLVDGAAVAVAWTGTAAAAAVAVSALAAASALTANRLLTALTVVLALASHTGIASSARACRHCARLPEA